MLKQMPLFTSEEYFYTTNDRIETPAGDLRSQSEKISLVFETVNSQRNNIWKKIFQIHLNLKYIKQKPEKY